LAKSKTTDKDIKVTIKPDITFTKTQLLKSQRFKDSRDLINAVFKDDRTYTVDEAIQLTDDFKKRGVK
jgi:hypothetical protein